MATSLSGGRSQSTRREPPTMGKQLVNFITCNGESSAPYFVNYKAGRETHAALVIGLYELLGNPTTWATQALISRKGGLESHISSAKLMMWSFFVRVQWGLVWFMVFTSLSTIFQLHAVSFIGEGNRSTRRKPPMKSLTNIIT